MTFRVFFCACVCGLLPPGGRFGTNAAGLSCPGGFFGTGLSGQSELFHTIPGNLFGTGIAWAA